MKQKLGINADCIGQFEIENLRKIKEHGFDTFFSSDYQFDKDYVIALKEEAEKVGLEYEFIHGPFAGINEMWVSKDEPRIFHEFKRAIDSASAAGVKTVIAHVSSGFTPPAINDLGVSRFDAWVEHAEKKGVILAFENLRRLGNLAYLMDRYEGNPCVKFCYDCGHEHCYTVSVPFAPIYADRLICTHLHDNLGQNKMQVDGGDSHLLPFDGNIDYRKMMHGLVEADYKGSLMLEVSARLYPHMSADEFLNTAYERVRKLLELAK